MAEEGAKRAAVIDGQIQYVSPTQIQKHRRCPRAWWFRYVARMPDKPPSQGVIRGIEGHARLEHYYKTTQNTLDALEQMGLELLPPPNLGNGQLVEHPISIETANGFPIVGKIDLTIFRDGGSTRVIDYKFKSDIEKWGTPAAALADPQNDNGVQMLSYAYAVGELSAGAVYPEWLENYSLEHIEFQYRGRRDVRHVVREISADEVRDRFEGGVLPELPKMAGTAKIKSALNVWGNEKACKDYGGCAYIDQCFDPIVRLKASIKALGTDPKENRMPILLSKQASDPNAVKNLAEATPAATPAPTVAAAPVGLLPPDQPKPVRPGVIFEVDGKPVSKEEFAAVPVAAPTTPVAAGPLEPTEKAAVLLGQPATRRRGRPASAPQPTVQSPMPQTVNPATLAPQPAAEVKGAASPKEVAGVADGIFVYIDCIPLGSATQSIVPLVDYLEAQILKAANLGENITDLRCAPKESPLGYDKWKAFLADLTKEDLKDNKIPPGRYVAHSDSDPRVRCVVEVLETRLPPGRVVRGLR